MDIKVVAQVCPKCGGTLQVDEGQKKVFCKYCGTGLQLDDGTREYHIVDVAKVNNVRLNDKIQEHNEKQADIREKQLAGFKRSTQTWVCLIIIFHLFMGGGIAFIKHFDTVPYIVEIWAFVGMTAPFILGLAKPDHIGTSRIRYIILFYFTLFGAIAIGAYANRFITKMLK